MWTTVRVPFVRSVLLGSPEGYRASAGDVALRLGISARRDRRTASVVRLAVAGEADDQHRAGRVPDDLDVVGRQAVPPEVVARPELVGMLTLRHPIATAQHDVVLVAFMAVIARRDARIGTCFDDRDVTGATGIDAARPSARDLSPAALGRPENLRRGRLLDQQPRRRNVEGARD